MKFNLFLLFVFFYSFIQAQSGKYDIVLFNNVIGNGSAIQEKSSDGAIIYRLKTEAKAKILFKEHTSFTDIDMKFKGNSLYSCKLKRENDGDWQDIVITFENGKHYFSENGKKVPVSKPITFTSTQLFFKEPIGVKEIYIERLNIFASIEKKEEGLYKTVIDGGDNYYRYENGILVEFRLKKGVNVYMNRL